MKGATIRKITIFDLLVMVGTIGVGWAICLLLCFTIIFPIWPIVLSVYWFRHHPLTGVGLLTGILLMGIRKLFVK